jgi:hypothetical protein
MSAKGQWCRFDRRQITSGLPPEADIFDVAQTCQQATLQAWPDMKEAAN